MDTKTTTAREAFDAAAAGERVGVFAVLDGSLADDLYECFRGLTVTQRMSVQVLRRHRALQLDWHNNGMLFLSSDPDEFRGWALDRCYVPAVMDEYAYQTVRPTLATAGRPMDVY